jgi:hypothetical protein
MFEALLAVLFTTGTGIILRSVYREKQYQNWLKDKNIR